MSKSDELREYFFQKGPWYAGVIYSPKQKIAKTFGTNSISRYLDDVNNSKEALDKQGSPLDFGVV
jgi:hypothetical protein